MEQTDLPGLTFQLAILPLSWREEQEGNKIFLHAKKCIREGLSHLPKGTFLFVYKAPSISQEEVSVAGLFCAFHL